MMNLLARILSHGFAFAVVAIIVVVLMYRGELFPEWELPGFLAIKSQPEATTEAGSGTVERIDGETAPAADLSAVTAEPPEQTEEPLTSAPATVAVDEIAAPETPESSAEPEQAMAPESMDATSNEVDSAAETSVAAQTEDTAPVADSVPEPSTDALSTEVPDETPATGTAAAGTESTDPVTDDATQPEVDAPPAESGITVDDSPSMATEEPSIAATAPTAAVDMAPADAEPTVIDEETPVETSPPAVQEPEPTPETAPATPPLAVPEAMTETPYEVMAKARESYWLRDFDAAEQHYRKLTQIDPDNPDGYGEMGNMYFSQGKWDEAAAAFYEAGTRLVKAGHLVQARQTVEVIRGLNGPQAEDLEAQVVAASPSSP